MLIEDKAYEITTIELLSELWSYSPATRSVLQ